MGANSPPSNAAPSAKGGGRRLSKTLLAAAAWLGLGLALAAGAARQVQPTGEELYVDRLGCWNCHGQAGEGLGGHGPAIAKTRLPLRRFIGQLRLPAGTMPPVPAVIASDAELTIVYRWLDGADAVQLPLPFAVGLRPAGPPGPGPQGTRVVEIDLAVTSDPKSAPAEQPVSLRLMLHGEAGPVAQQTVDYRAPGQSAWTTVTTDEAGEAMLTGERATAPPGRRASKPASGRVRVALPSGKVVLVVEALDSRGAERSVIVGIGSLVLPVS